MTYTALTQNKEDADVQSFDRLLAGEPEPSTSVEDQNAAALLMLVGMR